MQGISQERVDKQFAIGKEFFDEDFETGKEPFAADHANGGYNGEFVPVRPERSMRWAEQVANHSLLSVSGYTGRQLKHFLEQEKKTPTYRGRNIEVVSPAGFGPL